MSKFLKLLSENSPNIIGDKDQLLQDLCNVLTHLGFTCNDTEDGVTISIPKEEEAEDPSSPDSVARAVSVLTTADKAFPKQSLTKRIFSPQARAIQDAKDSAMNALVAAVKNAATTIQKSITPV